MIYFENNENGFCFRVPLKDQLVIPMGQSRTTFNKSGLMFEQFNLFKIISSTNIGY